jgi:hypothetical protein
MLLYNKINVPGAQTWCRNLCTTIEKKITKMKETGAQRWCRNLCTMIKTKQNYKNKSSWCADTVPKTLYRKKKAVGIDMAPQHLYTLATH